VFDVQGDTQILTFQSVGGQWVVIQAPVSLGWDMPNWRGSPAACRCWSPRRRGGLSGRRSVCGEGGCGCA
jgi:hypothetical protein